MSWLQRRNGGLHFILNDNDNYDFDVKVKCCGFVGFVNDVINCECLGYIFFFRIKEKEKDTFYINIYSIIFLYFIFFLILIMDLCVQFIIFAFYDELISNKTL